MSQPDGSSRGMRASAPSVPHFVGAGLRSEEVAEHAQLALHSVPTLATLIARSTDPLGFKYGLGALQLPEPLSRQLGRLAAENPELYQHHLIIVILADYLALGLQLSVPDRSALMIAALFHDAGLIGLDSLIPAAGDPEAMRIIDDHPQLAALLLRRCPEVPESAVLAVLQHHERVDGSGYPTHGTHRVLHPLGEILAVAEAVGSVLPKRRPAAMLIWLRLIRNSFRTDAIDLLARALQGIVLPGHSHPSEARLLVLSEQLGGQAALFDNWLAQRGRLEALALPDFVIDRLDRIYGMLAQLGIDLHRIELALDYAIDDEQVAQELLALAQEVDWQLGDLLRDIQRHDLPQSASWPAWRLELEALAQRVRAARGDHTARS
ncbi:HD domain-containing phosphohydrolase [Jeongeupia naejangsanensis]|uniref:HD domain-containing protein n=1 Tax=Jeongeupia naejangsanensis TaxID=613195 RepID=A0ABS2BPE3_9NEIS|nr:HD domain-containing phosphohydrolase [Jeongeupia naejangsanensis]MBM3117468.1 HD domain-containing protein [Jeongeupia naejangsanensis]